MLSQSWSETFGAVWLVRADYTAFIAPTNDVDDDETPIEGSGTFRRDPDNREKTLRVTFVVMEPFQIEYSDRDSEQFQNISIGLADAVNSLFDSVSGTQRASLVRIQSRLSDEFSCKVTMDITTSGFDDTKELARILQDHIRQRRQLGIFTVDENEFLSTDIIDPGTTNLECAADEIKCDDNHCIANWAWCNGSPDCPDGSDEASCQDQESEGEDQTNEVDQQTSTPTSNSQRKPDNDGLDTFSVAPNGENELIPETTTPRPERGDGDEGDDTTSSDTENEVIPETTTAQIDTCAAYEFRCDNTRCIHLTQRCDRQQDCDDGTDEAGCPSVSGMSSRSVAILNSSTCYANYKLKPINSFKLLADVRTSLLLSKFLPVSDEHSLFRQPSPMCLGVMITASTFHIN
ncbi:Low-density lipoprotein receptor [Papilio machaon]|uniref:Low-density lipoprotein receptor n=1 Tax=Papilio machaon TaxID=76193 RepID=A0A194QZ87_PAPMA|nr:Low-density lipoprotein receptor [Papilio machaon]